MNKNAEYFINHLGLEPHPEGGYFKEVYRAEELIDKNSLHERYDGERVHSTSIYFLLKSENISAFHRLCSDELWHFYEGSSLTIFIIDENGKLEKVTLGSNLAAGEIFQYTVKKNQWFGASVNDTNSFSLIGCTVAPGFDFNDFELGKRAELLKTYPEHEDIIKKLTI
jgi:uncharacterized protein